MRFTLHFCVALTIVSLTQLSSALRSAHAEEGREDPNDKSSGATSMLKGKVDVLERSQAYESENQARTKTSLNGGTSAQAAEPILNMITSAQADRVEVPHLSWKRKTGNFMLGANETGWIASLPGGSIQTPTYKDGSILVGGEFSASVFALDARTGNRIWHFGAGEAGPTALVVGHQFCAFNTASCTAYVLRAATGELVWQKRLAPEIHTEPAILGNFIYLTYFSPSFQTASGFHSLALLECRTLDSGKLVWQAQFPKNPVSAPVINQGRVYVTSSNGTVECFDAMTGRTISSNAMQASSAPLPVNGKVLVAQDKVRAGKMLGLGYDGHRPAIAEDSIVQIKNNSVEADDLKDGSERWKTDLDEILCKKGLFGPSVGKHDVYLTTGNGFIIVLNSKTGKQERCYDTGQSFDCQPCLANGNLYAGTRNGKVLCFPIGEDADGWNCWGGNAQHNM